MSKKRLLLLIPILALAGCASSLTVPKTDPVVAVCRNPVILNNLPELDQEVDNANNATNSALPIPKSMQGQLTGWATVLDQLAKTIPDPGTNYQIYFANHLIELAQEYRVAAASPTGYVSTATATAADSHTIYITAFCANLRIAGS